MILYDTLQLPLCAPPMFSNTSKEIRTKQTWQLVLLKKIKCINMSVSVSHCLKSGIPVEHRVIQPIYCEALQRLAQSQAQSERRHSRERQLSIRARLPHVWAEAPWKAPLTSSAFLQPQLLIHWCQARRGRRKRCAMVNVWFGVTINENSSSLID